VFLSDDHASTEAAALLKYFEIIDTIESSIDFSHRLKIEKRIRENRRTCMSVWDEVANLLTEADPHSEILVSQSQNQVFNIQM
jgi:hypothetical protein